VNKSSAEAVGKELLDCIEASGPWPFITRIVYRDADRIKQVWESRQHRKGLGKAETDAGKIARCLWAPGDLNWWIGSVFALGSTLFALGSILLLAPGLATSWSISADSINLIYFLGSIPFTSAAYLQLYQSANVPAFGSPAPPSPDRHRSLFGWRPRDIGWLSCALQFIGTLLFNLNTFDAMIPSLSWFQQDLAVWIPDLFGSILFLASGYLAFVETCHAHGAWKPESLSWWITLINLLGCAGFMIAALFAIILPGPGHPEMATLATAFTLQGAICFFLGSVLMLPEASAGKKVSIKGSQPSPAIPE
jgi:hypothetical protein